MSTLKNVVELEPVEYHGLVEHGYLVGKGFGQVDRGHVELIQSIEERPF